MYEDSRMLNEEAKKVALRNAEANENDIIRKLNDFKKRYKNLLEIYHSTARGQANKLENENAALKKDYEKTKNHAIFRKIEIDVLKERIRVLDGANNNTYNANCHFEAISDANDRKISEIKCGTCSYSDVVFDLEVEKVRWPAEKVAEKENFIIFSKENPVQGMSYKKAENFLNYAEKKYKENIEEMKNITEKIKENTKKCELLGAKSETAEEIEKFNNYENENNKYSDQIKDELKNSLNVYIKKHEETPLKGTIRTMLSKSASRRKESELVTTGTMRSLVYSIYNHPSILPKMHEETKQ